MRQPVQMQAKLGAMSQRRRASIPDLIIAACAHIHRATVPQPWSTDSRSSRSCPPVSRTEGLIDVDDADAR